MNHSQVLKAWERLNHSLGIPLKPIESEAEYDQMVELLDELVEASNDIQHGPYANLIHLLGTYVAAWDEQHYSIESAEPKDSLAALIQEHKLTQNILSVATGISQGEISRLLRGERTFSIAHAKTLAQYFRVSPEVFM